MFSRGEDLLAARERRPFRHRGLVRRSALFPAGLLFAFAVYPFGHPSYGGAFVAAAVVVAASVAATLLLPWRLLPQAAQTLPPLLFMLVVALLRQAHGGITSYTPLLLVPVIWLALYGTRLQLLLGIAAAAAALAVPIVLVGAPAYPASEWRRAASVVFVGVAVGFTIRALVGIVLAQIGERERLELRLRELEAFELHDDVVQRLTTAQLAFALDDPRRARSDLDHALGTVQRIVARQLMSDGGRLTAGSLVRERPAGTGNGA